MPALFTQQLSLQLDSGEWLFTDLDFSPTERLVGLVGRNGIGKSRFAALLSGEIMPTCGTVTRPEKLACYSQMPSERLTQSLTIGQFLGLEAKLNALSAIEQGSCDPHHFELVGDAWDLQTKTEQTLAALRLPTQLETPCHTLSGGQLAALQLHQLFQTDADVLILDEPSNHLDGLARQWLINEMHRFDGQIIMISHDRHLLRQVDVVYQLTTTGLSRYAGNYDIYRAQADLETQALDRQIKQTKTQQKQLKRQAQINHEKAQQRAAQGNRARKDGSQPKILLDAMKDKAGQSLSRAAKNQQAQQTRNQDKLHQLMQQQAQVKPQALYLPKQAQSKKSALLTVKECQLNAVSQTPCSFHLTQGQRCRLKGANGCGKSTLLKAIAGQHGEYQGHIVRHGNAIYLDQHFALLDSKQTDTSGALNLLSYLMQHTSELSESDARTLLAGIGFRRDTVYRPITQLSGGEKMKLAMLLVSHTPNAPLLLLDEPDNHLDLESKYLLAQALQDYQGAFILVTHDEDFVAEVGIDKVVVLEAL